MIENFAKIYRDAREGFERIASDPGSEDAFPEQISEVAGLVTGGKSISQQMREALAVALITAAAAETLHSKLRADITRSHDSEVPQELTYEFVDTFAIIEGVKGLLGTSVMQRSSIEITHTAYAQSRRALEKLIELSIGYMDAGLYLRWLGKAYLPERTRVLEEQFIAQVTC